MRSTEKIKKLVKNLDLDIDINAKTDHAILNELFEAQKNYKQTKPAFISPNIRNTIMKSPMTRLAVAAGVILAVFAGIKIIGGLMEQPAEQIAKQDSTRETIEDRQSEDRLNAELSEVRQMAAVGDVKGLATMLSGGQLESKLVAANFLAKMGKLPPLGRVPALETLSMHASEKLIIESRSGKIVLRSTKSDDRLEMTADALRVHNSDGAREARQVRVTYDIDGNDEQWQQRQMEFGGLRQKRTDLERELAELGENPAKDVSELRERLAKYSRILDGMDEAAYAGIDNGRLKLSCPFRHRTAFAELHNGIVRVEWHGNIVEADSVTLLLGLAPVRTDGPPPPVTGWRDRFDMVYSLDDGEVLRWVRYPYIPERQIYATEELHYYAAKNPPPPGYMFFRWDGTLYNWALSMAEGSLGQVLRHIGLNRYEYNGPEKIRMLKLGGDWIERKNAPVEDKLIALEQILQDELGRTITFEKRTVSRESIIVRGQYKHVPIAGTKHPKRIYVYPDSWKHLSGPEPVNGGGTGNLARLIEKVGSRFDRPVVFETEDLSDIRVSHNYSTSYSFATANAKTSEEMQKILDSVLANLSKQTSLKFEYDQRDQDVWFITE